MLVDTGEEIDSDKQAELKMLRTLLGKHAGEAAAGEILAKIPGAKDEQEAQAKHVPARRTLNLAAQHEEACKARVEAAEKAVEAAKKVLEEATEVHRARVEDHAIATQAKEEAYAEFKKEMEGQDQEVLEVAADGKPIRKAVECLKEALDTPEMLVGELTGAEGSASDSP
eukprot:8205992-Alexandrium_andersonii.AAC.1